MFGGYPPSSFTLHCWNAAGECPANTVPPSVTRGGRRTHHSGRRGVLLHLTSAEQRIAMFSHRPWGPPAVGGRCQRHHPQTGSPFPGGAFATQGSVQSVTRHQKTAVLESEPWWGCAGGGRDWNMIRDITRCHVASRRVRLSGGSGGGSWHGGVGGCFVPERAPVAQACRLLARHIP